MPSEIFLILSEVAIRDAASRRLLMVRGRTAKHAASLPIVQVASAGLLRSFAQPAFAICARPPM